MGLTVTSKRNQMPDTGSRHTALTPCKQAFPLAWVECSQAHISGFAVLFPASSHSRQFRLHVFVPSSQLLSPHEGGTFLQLQLIGPFYQFSQAGYDSLDLLGGALKEFAPLIRYRILIVQRFVN